MCEPKLFDKPVVVISASYQPYLRKWTSMAVDIKNSGTHENYNVLFSSVCKGIYYKDESTAKRAAKTKAREVLSKLQQ